MKTDKQKTADEEVTMEVDGKTYRRIPSGDDDCSGCVGFRNILCAFLGDCADGDDNYIFEEIKGLAK